MVNIKALAFSSLLLGLTAAAPAEDIEVRGDKGVCRPVGRPRTIVANYDDLKFTEPDVTPVGTYKELTYSNFFVDQDDGFIPAASGNQTAMSFDCHKKRLISVAEKGDSFDLISFNYACVSGYPQNACQLGLTGTYTDGTTISRPFWYPALDNTKPFYNVKIYPDGNWKNLKSIEITGGIIDGTCDYTGVFIDDLTYSKRKCR